MNFAAIDFETANEKRWSPCEVSITKVIDGSVVGSLTTFIKPHPSVDFNPWNIQIHGIQPSNVALAPGFDDVLPRLLEFSEGLPLVAHSAGFDMGVLSQTASLYSMRVPETNFFCTRVLTKRSISLDLPNYKLANVCEALNIPFGETHRAEADAIACAQVVLSLSRLEGAETLEELSSLLGVSPGTLSDSDFRGTKSHRIRFQSSLGKGAAAEYRASLTDEDMALDEDFNGKEVIFTGGLVSMDRKSAQERVISAGGFTGNNVTKKTAIVVVGSPYDSSLKPGAELSGKLQKVLDLRAAGADIELLTESEFLELFEN